MNRVICIWLPAWPIQRLLVARPELNVAPLVLHARDPRRGQRVVACCEQARQRGVLLGMPLAEVAALSQRGVVFGRNQAGGRGSRRAIPIQHQHSARREPRPPETLLEKQTHLPRSAVDSRFTDASDMLGKPSTSPRPGSRIACSPPERGRLAAIQLHEHQAEHDYAALAELAVWCEQFSPIVGLEESDSPACLLLDVTGLGPLFGHEYHLAELIVCAFRRRGYQVRVGVADTIGAAWALARYGTSSRGQAGSRNPKRKRGKIRMATWPRSRFLKLRYFRNPTRKRGNTDIDFASLTRRVTKNIGKMAKAQLQNSRFGLQATIVVAPPGQSRTALEPLPVEALRLPAETGQTLQQLGVCTILQLWQLPRDGLAARLGKALIQRIDQALGAQPEVIVAHRPPPEFAAEWLLEHPTDRRDTLETILSRLTEQVAVRLAQSDHAAVQVQACLEGQTTSRCLQVGLFQPSSNPRHIDDLLRLQLETIQMRQPVQRVRLAAVTTVRLTSQQHALWEDAGKGTQRELALLVDRLSSRLGKEQVFGVQVQAEALPERAVSEKPLADIMASRRHVRASVPVSIPAHRPLWLQEPPQPLEMVSVAADGLVGDGPPIFFRFQNMRHDVARYWGPERIETGWWRGRSVRRDYYRVETTTGFRFWLFRRLSDDAWFLHGCFE